MSVIQVNCFSLIWSMPPYLLLAVTMSTSLRIWATYSIIDAKLDASTYNITVNAPNGSTIEGPSSYRLSNNGDTLTVVAISSTEWHIT